MANRRESIHVLEEIGQGDGDLFITPINTIVSDYTDRTQFLHVGATSGGFTLESEDAELDILSGSPEERIKQFLVRTGMTLSVSFAEALATQQWKYALGHGAAEEVSAGNVDIDNHRFQLFSDHWIKLPYQNMTIDEIRDDAPTPNSYTGSDITDNFEIDLVQGRIRALSAAEGGSVFPETYGSTYFLDGAWAKPREQILTLTGDTDEEKNYHSVLFIVPKGRYSRAKTIFIPKAYPTAIEAIEFKTGTPRLVGCVIKSALSPSANYQCKIMDEVE
jgi:hypothetical protein